MKKKIFLLLASISSVALLGGCQNSNISNSNNEDTLYTYIDNSKKEDFLSTPIGNITEEPILNNENKKTGNRLYVKSSKELLTRENIVQFYSDLKPQKDQYQEIVVEISKTEAIQILTSNSEAWFCRIDENMNLSKVKKINF